MRLRLLALASAAVCIAAASAPASACPGRGYSSFSPPAGGLLREGSEITVTGPAAVRLARAGELRLWSTDHQIPLRVEEGRRGRIQLVPAAPLEVGTQYHLVAASDDHPGWTAPLGVKSPWWTAAARDRRAELGTLASRLAAFGLLPFALGFVVTRTIIIRRRRKVIREL
jgi:hypothetical protein